MTIFSILMAAVAIPVWIVPDQSTYSGLLIVAFLLGLAGSSFAIGVGYVSRWTPPERQGSALGIYGLGNIGQSAAVFLGPVIAARVGMAPVYHGVAIMLVIWAVAFGLLARNAPAPATAQRKGLGVMIEVLTREKLSWLLSAFYFLTFGGFVAFSIYLPTLLKDEFHLAPADAGFRTAGFVVLATLLRPLGGWLSDRIGGARVLSAVFLGVAPFALLMAWSSMIPFTVGALGCAALLGLGNGAVFKLVPQYFPTQTGTVTGLVGAMGGLGGFFPPLLLAFFRSRTGAIWPGFALLAITAWVLWWANHKVFVPRQQALDIALPADLRRTADRVRAGAWATLWTALLVAAIVVGSRNLQNFDPALVIYTFAVVFATWGVVYHYNVWLEKPPTRVYWDRGWELYRRRGVVRSLFRVSALAATHLAGQRFIAHRSRLRWWMHQCLFWGCMLAVAITFPLVFGWIHFRTLPGDQLTYVTYLFGFPMGSFPPAHAHRLAALSRPGYLGSAGAGRYRALSVAPDDRQGRTHAAAIRHGLPADHHALRDLRHRPGADRVAGMAARLRVQLPGDPACHHRDRRAALSCRSASSSTFSSGRPNSESSSTRRPASKTPALTACAAASGSPRGCTSTTSARCSRRSGSITPHPGPAGHWQALCPACKRKSLSTAQLRIKEQSRG